MPTSTLAERAVRSVSRYFQRRAPQGGSNPFLEGPFAPVAVETTHTALSVEGRLPPELNGMYARIGPNPVHAPNPATYHWFVGDGMVHGVRLADGQALWYRSRWIGSDTVRRAQGKAPIPGPRRGISDVVNTNVFAHAGSIWATVEAGMLPVELDGELESLRYGYFNDERSLPFSAHPHRDPLTGALHAVCYDATDPRRLRYVVVDRHGRVETAQTIPVSHGPMVHDCAITRSRLVVLDLPVTFTLSAVLKGAAFPYAWNPRHPARVGLVPKGGSAADPVWCEVDPCFVFHTCNAFDNEDGTVTLDAVVHARMFDRSRQGPELGQRRVRFERWRIDPRARRVTRECIDEREQEFPRFDERLTGEPYRHAYSISFDTGSPTGPTPNALHALDLRTGRVQVRDFGAGHWPSEAVFVPRNEAAAEQDGWLLTLVTTDRDAALHVLDAADITAPAVAKVSWPTRVPLGFHANWIPQVR